MVANVSKCKGVVFLRGKINNEDICLEEISMEGQGRIKAWLLDKENLKAS